MNSTTRIIFLTAVQRGRNNGKVFSSERLIVRDSSKESWRTTRSYDKGILERAENPLNSIIVAYNLFHNSCRDIDPFRSSVFGSNIPRSMNTILHNRFAESERNMWHPFPRSFISLSRDLTRLPRESKPECTVNRLESLPPRKLFS